MLRNQVLKANILAILLICLTIAVSVEANTQNIKGIKIMVVDQGFDFVAFQNADPETAEIFDMNLLRSIKVPAALYSNSREESLLISNMAAHIRYNMRQSPVETHLSLVAAMAAEATIGLGMNPDTLIPVVDPGSLLGIKRVNHGPFYSSADLFGFVEKSFSALDGIIKSQGVRIFIRSLGLPKTGAEKLCKDISFNHEIVEECLQKLGEFYNQQFRKLFRGNPNTVFVVAAGNSSEEMHADEFVEFDSFREDNVLPVAAVDESGLKLTDYSNWAADVVRVAARGTIYSKFVGHVSGTSFAAPRAAAHLRETVVRNLQLSGAELIKLFLKDRTHFEPLLLGKIKGGRVVNDRYHHNMGTCQLLVQRAGALLVNSPLWPKTRNTSAQEN